jgi:hypothetical protein
LRSVAPDRAFRRRNARAVDRAVQSSERLLGERNRRADLSFIRDVGLRKTHLRSELLCEGGAALAQIADHDVRTGARELAHARGTEPRASAGYQKRPSVNLHRVAFLACVELEG